MNGAPDYANATVQNPEGHTLRFNGNGNLVRIEDKPQAEPSFIDVAYLSGDKISQVTDGAGGRYRFVYSGDRVSEIQYIGKTGTAVVKKVSYRYDETQKNVKYLYATGPDGKVRSYYFYPGGGMEYFGNVDGSAVSIQTDSNDYTGKTVRLSECGRNGTLGDQLTFAYDTMQTTIGDANGNRETYQFDWNGRVTGIRNQEGEAVLASYGGSEGQLLGFSKIRSTGIGVNLVSSINYGPTGVAHRTYDGEIPALQGRTYSELSTSRGMDATVKAVVNNPSDGAFQAGDVLTFGGWLKGNLQGAGTGAQSDRGVTIQIKAYPQNGTLEADAYEVRPNPYVADWQYVLQEVTLEHPVDKIEMTLHLNGQANHAYVSSLECKRQGKAQSTAPASPEPGGTEATLPTPVCDAYGNVLKEVDERGAVTEYTYDAAGNQTSRRKTADGKWTASHAGYDADKNMVLQTIDADGRLTEYRYGEDKSPSLTFDNPDNGCTAYQYNEAGELVGRSYYNYYYGYDRNEPPDSVTSYTHKDGSQTVTTANNTYSVFYNAFGDVGEIKRGGQRLAAYEYQKDSNRIPTKVTYGNGQSVSYRYNQKNQLETDGQGVYDYDEQGGLASVTDSANQTRTEYKGGQTTVYNTGKTSPLYRYEEKDGGSTLDKNGTKVGVAVQREDPSNGTVEEALTYNGTTAATRKTTTDKLGRPHQNETKTANNANLLKKTYGYPTNSDNRTTERASSVSYTIGASVTESDTYTYDYYGNVTSVKDKGGNLKKYTYDKMGQLVREDDPVRKKSVLYTYSEGNLTKKEEYAYTTTTAKGAHLGTTEYGYGNSNWKDLLTSYNGQAIAYDTIGNPTSYMGRTMAWEKGRQLKSHTKGGTTTSYSYDVNGLRTKKKVGSATYEYTYQNGQLLAYEEGGNKMMLSYDQAGNPFGLWYNGGKYYYQTNLQGDVVGIVNESGTKVASYDYDAWGKLTNIAYTNEVGKANPLRYRGYVYDEDTGWYYLQSRYYDPEVGRFLNADDPLFLGASETVLSYNLFVYCENNPVNNIDPTGYLTLNNALAKVGEILNKVVNKFTNYLKSLIMYKNGKLSISTTVIATTIDVIIAAVINGLIYRGIKSGMNLLMRNQSFRNSFVGGMFKFFLENKAGKLVLWTIVHIGFIVAGRKGAIGTAVDSVLKDFLANIAFSRTQILQKAASLVSAFSSIGGIVALFLDLMDRKWDNYVSLKI